MGHDSTLNCPDASAFDSRTSESFDSTGLDSFESRRERSRLGAFSLRADESFYSFVLEITESGKPAPSIASTLRMTVSDALAYHLDIDPAWLEASREEGGARFGRACTALAARRFNPYLEFACEGLRLMAAIVAGDLPVEQKPEKGLLDSIVIQGDFERYMASRGAPREETGADADLSSPTQRFIAETGCASPYLRIVLELAELFGDKALGGKHQPGDLKNDELEAYFADRTVNGKQLSGRTKAAILHIVGAKRTGRPPQAD